MRGNMPVLPIVDLRSLNSTNALASRLLEVGRDPGFFYLLGHEISPELIQTLFMASKTFFKTTSASDKERFRSRSGEPVNNAQIKRLFNNVSTNV